VSFTRLRARGALAMVAVLVFAAACAHKTDPNAEPEPIPDPVALHVKNENFLDMNIALVVSGVSRRLGNVIGNSSADFSIDGQLALGQTIYLTATPIGGRGQATSGGLSVSPGQMIEFTVAATLRQSMATVREPR
jgi:hypothetical protein